MNNKFPSWYPKILNITIGILLIIFGFSHGTINWDYDWIQIGLGLLIILLGVSVKINKYENNTEVI